MPAGCAAQATSCARQLHFSGFSPVNSGTYPWRQQTPIIAVNVLSPGNVTSPGADKIRDTLAKDFGIGVDALTAGIPLGRIGRPTDISELVGFLLSERAAWITGATFHVDGGDSPFVG